MGVIFPLIVVTIGILASAVGILMVRASNQDRTAMAPINRGFATAGVLTVAGTFLVAEFYAHNLRIFWAVLSGVVLGQAASRISEYFTSTETSPVREIAESARTGPATTVLSGISSGLESTVWAIIAIALAIGGAIAVCAMVAGLGVYREPVPSPVTGKPANLRRMGFVAVAGATFATAQVDAFGFGGINAVAILERAS